MQRGLVVEPLGERADREVDLEPVDPEGPRVQDERVLPVRRDGHDRAVDRRQVSGRPPVTDPQRERVEREEQIAGPLRDRLVDAERRDELGLHAALALQVRVQEGSEVRRELRRVAEPRVDVAAVERHEQRRPRALGQRPSWRVVPDRQPRHRRHLEEARRAAGGRMQRRPQVPVGPGDVVLLDPEHHLLERLRRCEVVVAPVTGDLCRHPGVRRLRDRGPGVLVVEDQHERPTVAAAPAHRDSAPMARGGHRGLAVRDAPVPGRERLRHEDVQGHAPPVAQAERLEPAKH